uniref:putative nuclease HARBI1 n=1 Tax=Pristiophorus japonicus TaxID=55135 RepID=UPI00398EC64E
MRCLRFTKEVLIESSHLLQADLHPQSRARTALRVAVKVTVALNFASGAFQAGAGDICNISQFAVHSCIREMSEALYARRGDYILFSLTREKQVERACGFARIAGFPMVQGDIDCTHVALWVPHFITEMYHNRKGFYSLNVHLVCGHTQRVMQVNARYPGSSHDAFILQQSALPSAFEPPRQTRDWLLGDKGYLLTTWLMTPLCKPRTRQQHAYNESHAATWNLIEQIIGVLKQCFSCLDRSRGVLPYSPERISNSSWSAACSTTSHHEGTALATRHTLTS